MLNLHNGRNKIIKKTINSLRGYGLDFSSEMEKEVKKALKDSWNDGYKTGRSIL